MLQDDLLTGGQAVPNTKIVDEAFRVIDSRAKGSKATREALLDALQQHYPEAKMANLRRALERTKPYLDDAGGDLDRARDMVARRRDTGAKTYGIAAGGAAGANAFLDGYDDRPGPTIERARRHHSHFQPRSKSGQFEGAPAYGE